MLRLHTKARKQCKGQIREFRNLLFLICFCAGLFVIIKYFNKWIYYPISRVKLQEKIPWKTESRKENACNNPMIIITNNKMPPLYFPKIWLQKSHRSSISELIQPLHKAKEKRAMVIIISLNYSLTWLLMAGKIHTSRNIKKVIATENRFKTLTWAKNSEYIRMQWPINKKQ